MIKSLNESNLPAYIKFILYISFIEISFSFIFKMIGLQAFQMIPYVRLVVLLFTTIYFLNYYLKNKLLFKVRIEYNSENNLIIIWVLLTLFGCLIGIINKNPILYFITDLVYILFGYSLYRLFLTDEKLINEIRLGLNNKQEKKLIFYFLFITILTFVLRVDTPPAIVIFSLVYSLYFYGLKKFKYMTLCTIPFLLQVLTANRAILLVYIFICIFYVTQNKFSKKKLVNLFLTILVLIILTPLFVPLIIKLIISIPGVSQVLRDRLVQVQLIFSGKANWNSPSMLSLKQRIDEASAVLSFWRSNPSNFLFGGGMGATLEGYAFKDSGVGSSALLGKSAIHNIHLLPFSLIFRYGFFGLVLFVLIMSNFCRYFVRILTSTPSQFTIIICFQFCWILYSLPAAAYLWTNPFFWITLAYLSNEKKIFNT